MASHFLVVVSYSEVVLLRAMENTNKWFWNGVHVFKNIYNQLYNFASTWQIYFIKFILSLLTKNISKLLWQVYFNGQDGFNKDLPISWYTVSFNYIKASKIHFIFI